MEHCIPKRQKNDLELDQKREIIKYYEANTIIHETIEKHFSVKWNIKIGRSTVYEMVNNRDKYFDVNNLRSLGVKRLSEPDNPYLEEQLYLWFADAVSQGIPICEDAIIRQSQNWG